MGSALVKIKKQGCFAVLSKFFHVIFGEGIYVNVSYMCMSRATPTFILTVAKNPLHKTVLFLYLHLCTSPVFASRSFVAETPLLLSLLF